MAGVTFERRRPDLHAAAGAELGNGQPFAVRRYRPVGFFAPVVCGNYLSRAAFFRFVRADRLLTPYLAERDGRRVLRLEMGLVDNQICSLRNRGEHANPAKLFEMVGFSVSPPVNPMPARRPSRIRDSSR